jgi:hypothetical protein
MAEQLFWAVVTTWGTVSDLDGRRRGGVSLKMPIHVVDTTVIELVANCMDWA